MNNLYYYMRYAIKEAEDAGLNYSVPVGAVIVRDSSIISSAGNKVIRSKDPTAHAEILAIRKACKIINSSMLEDCDIFVTLEPCAMCAQAISLARIRRLYFGAYDIKYGAVVHGCNIFNYSLHKPEVVGGVLETRCKKILQDFFENKRC